jgi:hypothetical protein
VADARRPWMTRRGTGAALDARGRGHRDFSEAAQWATHLIDLIITRR